MNVFASGHRHQPWVWQVTFLCFVLGFLLAASLQTVRTVSRAGLGLTRFGQGASVPIRTDNLNKLQKEIAKLQDDKTKLETSLAQGSSQAKTLNDELQKTKLMAGLTDVRGPGIILTLQDSKKLPSSQRVMDAANYIIHDVDLQKAVNELQASGAEAIAINDQRIVARTAIRCVGPTIQVNGVPLAAPFHIKVIGDPGSLEGGMNLPLGVLDGLRRTDPDMFKMEKKTELLVPAFTGSTEIRFAKPVRGGAEKDKSDR